jgi:aryl-alcohol dehydrogenase-like predicted oxidoreductase
LHVLFTALNKFIALKAFGSESAANQALVDQTVLATKFLAIRDADNNFVGSSAKPEVSRASCERSLKILPKIDLFYMHRFAGDCTIEEAMQGLAALVKEGKVKSIGLSEVSAATLERAHAVHPVACVQVIIDCCCAVLAILF